MTEMKGADALARLSLFSYFEPPELEELYQAGTTRQQASQSNAVIEGEKSRGLYIILSGRMAVLKLDPYSQKLVRLTYLEAGDAFGELSLFDDAPRNATVVAEGSCELFYLDLEAFEAFCNKKGDNLKVRFYKRCAEMMAQRFRTQNAEYISAQNRLWKHALSPDAPKT
jgi:CRP-like cAMP-binding protein